MLCPDSLHQILGLVRLIIQALGDWGLLTKFFKSDLQFQIHVHQDLFDTRVVGGGDGGIAWVNFYWVFAAGISEPLPHYSLFCGQI